MKHEINNIFTEIPKTLLLMVSKILVDGQEYSNIKEWAKDLKPGDYTLIINPLPSKIVRIKVKSNALHDSPFFQFHKQHNNNIPIPLTEMYGIKVDEKDKTVKMDLWDKEHKIHWVGWLLKSWILEESKL